MAFNEKEKALLDIIKKQVNDEPFYGDQYKDRAEETHDWSVILKLDTLDNQLIKALHTLVKKEVITSEPTRQGSVVTIRKGKKWN